MATKGIILAGGSGSRLRPATQAVIKQLLPVYDKPMIYYPLATLMSAAIQEVLVITQRGNIPNYQMLFGNGRRLGMDIEYATQHKPRGIAEALTIAVDCDFLQHDDTAVLILGDNLFAGAAVSQQLVSAVTTFGSTHERATIFLAEVKDPQRYGVVGFDDDGEVIELVEKPVSPPSNWAVTGLYIYGAEAATRVRKQKPSARDELEITDLNRTYLEASQLQSRRLARGTAWLDTGTPEALLQASQYVQTIQERHGIMLGCPEAEAWHNGWINADTLRTAAFWYDNAYGAYLHSIVKLTG